MRLRFAIVAGVGALVLVIPHSGGIDARAWRLLAIFLATLAGIILRPLPMSAIAIIGLAVSVATRTLTITEALSGFSNTISWLVVATFFLAAGFTITGLGSRIAYGLVALSGRSTLALGYSLMVTDLVLAPAIASNTARAGGVVFPILQSIARTVLAGDSEESRRARAFITLTAYQSTVVTGAMFMTAMVANPLVVQFAANQGITITWTDWARAAAVPGLISLALVPVVVYRVCRPPGTLAADARTIATAALRDLGPMKSSEWIMAVTSSCLLVAWIAGPSIALDPTAAALIAIAALLAGGVLRWENLLGEHEAWNTFVWFSVLVMMAGFLGQRGVIAWFSTETAAVFQGVGWLPGFLGLSLVYFYTHYLFASNTAHAGAMYAPFLGVALTLGTPPMLAALVLAFFSNLCACTTHYGTPPGPVLFASGYVPLSTWWQAGALISVLHLVIWLGVGSAWWRWLGLW